jgi:hypothetical protein
MPGDRRPTLAWRQRLPPPATREEWAARMVRWRDAVLVAGGLAYVVGYVARALHAWWHGLGPVPAVQFQYVVAGLALALPIGAVGFGIWAARRALVRLAEWAREDERRGHEVDVVLSALWITALLLLGLGLSDWAQRLLPPALAGWLLLVAAAVVVLVAPVAFGYELVGNAAQGDGRLSGALARFGASGGAAMGALIALSQVVIPLLGMIAIAGLAGLQVLEWLPQEFGGARVQCASVDLALKELSPATRELLIEGASDATPGADVRRSRPLDVYSAGDPLIVKPGKSEAPALRLDKAAVRSLQWCP